MNTAPRSKKVWDVIVIGGGPAGMMAAGRAAELGRSVLLLEKNSGLGKKLLITGGGRCNVTNAEPNLRTLVSKYKGSDQFLFSAFSQYDNNSGLAFFNTRNMPTKIENEGRVFPVSDTARSVWEVLTRYMEQGKVQVQTDAAVIELVLSFNNFAKLLNDNVSKENRIQAVRLADGSQLEAKSFVIATGGNSRPETGSTGDGFKWLKKLGHRIIPTNRALVPIALKDAWVKKLAGVTLQGIKLTTILDGEKQSVRKGKILFTHFGVTGPTVLNLSRSIGELLPYGEVVLLLDLLPQFDHGALKAKLHFLLTSESNKKIKNSLASLIPADLYRLFWRGSE